MGRKSAPAPTRRAAPAPAPAPRAAAAPPPARMAPPPAAPAPMAPHAPPPMMAPPQQSGGMLSGIGSTIVQGMAFGTGSAIARRAVDSVVDSFSSKDSAPAPAPAAPVQRAPVMTGPCALDNTAFLQCMQQNSNNVSACESYYQALQQCQSANGASGY